MNDKHYKWIRAEKARSRREQAAQKEAAIEEGKAAKRKADKAERDSRAAAQQAHRDKESAEDSMSIKKKLAGLVNQRKFTQRERSFWNRCRDTPMPKGA